MTERYVLTSLNESAIEPSYSEFNQENLTINPNKKLINFEKLFWKELEKMALENKDIQHALELKDIKVWKDKLTKTINNLIEYYNNKTEDEKPERQSYIDLYEKMLKEPNLTIMAKKNVLIEKNKELIEKNKNEIVKNIKNELLKIISEKEIELLIPGTDPNIYFSGISNSPSKTYTIGALNEIQNEKRKKINIIGVCGALQAAVANQKATLLMTSTRAFEKFEPKLQDFCNKNPELYNEWLEDDNQKKLEYFQYLHCGELSKSNQRAPIETNVNGATFNAVCAHNFSAFIDGEIIKRYDGKINTFQKGLVAIGWPTNDQLEDALVLACTDGEYSFKRINASDIAHTVLDINDEGKIVGLFMQHHIDGSNMGNKEQEDGLFALINQYNNEGIGAHAFNKKFVDIVRKTNLIQK